MTYGGELKFSGCIDKWSSWRSPAYFAKSAVLNGIPPPHFITIRHREPILTVLKY